MVDITALPGSLDLFELMVNYVAGGVFMSLIIWAVILLITGGVMGRMSMQTLLVLLTTYFAVASVGYVGALAAVPLFLWSVWYATTGVIRYINSV